jgi:hypothetical protein
MQGWIFAADSPYAVVTGEDGTVEIDDVPPGEFTLKMWHPFLGIREQSVTLAAGESSEVELATHVTLGKPVILPIFRLA